MLLRTLYVFLYRGPSTDGKFNVGDRVVDPSANERGVVIEVYEFEGDHKYVIQFESGREAALFESELVPAGKHPAA